MKWTILALAVPLLAACSGPQSTLDPAGPAAQQVATVWWYMFGVASVVWVGVSLLWVYALARKPKHTTAKEARAINRRWVIGGGIVLPTVSIILLLLFGVPTGRTMLPLPVDGQQPLVVEVTGHQWWWEVHYPETGVTTANQFIIPAGRPIDVHLTSADVIHSFWVPRLGGKRDMVPGRIHEIRVEASYAGVFRGQCSEFCGAQHTRMILHVEALEPEAFDQWLGQRQAFRPPALPAGPAGQEFRDTCGQCHQVAGITEGERAPDLTDLASRPTLGAGTLDNDAAGLRRWLREHQTIKAGNAMPTHDHIDDDTLEQIAAWLETLAP